MQKEWRLDQFINHVDDFIRGDFTEVYQEIVQFGSRMEGPFDEIRHVTGDAIVMANGIAVAFDELLVGGALAGILHGGSNEDLAIVPEFFGINLDGIALDHASILQTVDARSHCGRRQMDALCQMVHFDPAVFGQFFKD